MAVRRASASSGLDSAGFGGWLVLVGTGILGGAGAIVLDSAFPEWRLLHYPLHAAVESVGAFAALIVAVLVLGLTSHGYLGAAYTWVAAALIGMGLLDGLHAVMHAGDRFVWLHSSATFVGGTVCVFVWLSDRLAGRRWVRAIPVGVFAAAAVLAAGSLTFPELVPEMVVDGRFALAARVANIVGGLGFLGAAAYFMLRVPEASLGRGRLVFASLCLLFGLSGVIFELSAIWDAAWWFWHFLRICAYMIAVAFCYGLTRRIEGELVVLKRRLERNLEESTASLATEADMRRQAEFSLRKIGMAVEQSPVMIFITDRDAVIEYVNPKFERITGYLRDEAIGQNPRLIRSPWTPPEVHTDMWNTILAGQEWRAELRDRRKDGSEFWANASISPIRDASGEITHFVAMHEDITDRKLAEAAMRTAHDAAELANKAKTDLLANMSHELRTPMNAIIGFSTTMAEGILGPIGNAKYAEYTDHIRDSATHLLELINDILDVSAVEAGKIELREETLDPTEVLAAAMRLLRPKAEQGRVALTGCDGTGLPGLRADERRMKQILINLLSNAVKFTDPGGSVSCSARVDPRTGELVIAVGDTGIGMDQAGIVKALSKFGQVDSSLSRRHDGTGLGLPLTKGLVELHGGTLELRSKPGEGTVVTVRFPAERVVPRTG